VDASTRLQTITGWEAVAQAGQEDTSRYLAYRDQLFDEAVDWLGIDRFRVEVASGIENAVDHWTEFRAGRIDTARWRELRYSTVNDNGDPFDLRRSGFHWGRLDSTIESVVLPMKQRLEARGRRLFLNMNYVAFTGQIGSGLQYHHQNPEEYAEFVQATYEHLSERYGFVPDAWEIQLEPDNSREWGAGTMRQAMIAAGNRLQAMGITPRFIAPSTTNMARAVTYADGIAGSSPPRFWSELSYHRYSGVSEEALQAIASRAQQLGLATAMLEHIGSGYEDLHQDLKIGRNSAWQQFALAFPASDSGSAYFLVEDRDGSPRVRPGSRTRFLRQYFYYVRRGAVRIGAASSDPAFDPLAFTNSDGKQVVVVKADRRGTFILEGLAAGSYEVTYTTAENADVKVGVLSLGSGSGLRLDMPARGVMTIAGG
jgi:hypothetical protein